MIFDKRSTVPFSKLIIEVLVKQIKVNLPLYREIYKRHEILPKLIKQQIKEFCIERVNCMWMP